MPMFNTLSVKMRLVFILALLCAIAVLLSALGLRALGATNASLRTVYEDRLIAIGQLHEVLTLTQLNHITAAEGVVRDAASLPAEGALVAQRMERVGAVWKAYSATFLTPEEKVLVGRFDG